jgi:hypothetical protein
MFAKSGLLDSGVNASISARTAGDIRRASYETNLNNLFNLLNLATGSSAQIQSPILSNAQMLSQRLAGITPSTTSGNYNGSTTTRTNFFASPFGQGVGQGVGQAGAAWMFCWVASEIFGGWNRLMTRCTRIYIQFIAPEWFKNLYIKYGKQFSKIVKQMPLLKKMLTPLFVSFAKKGLQYAEQSKD